MAVCTRFLLLTCVMGLVTQATPPVPETPKGNILMLLPFASPSHRNCFLPLAKELAERGHKITILSPLPAATNHPNIKEIDHGVLIMETLTQDMFAFGEEDDLVGFFSTVLPKLARDMYAVPAVDDLYKKKGSFDLMLIDDLFNEFAYPFLQGSTYGKINTAGVVSTSSAAMGNVLNPSYVASIFNPDFVPTSFLGRWKNLFVDASFATMWNYWGVYPAIEKELFKRFPDFPGIAEIARNASLVLANGHFSISGPVPLLPSQVEVGGMHCRPAKPLPQDLNSFIESSRPEGVIYFSLGSITRGNTMPEKYKNIFIDVFREMKHHKIIWKFESDIPNLPSNVMLKKWLPQQDILAHPKVKLFITHGGLLSIQESLYHGTPLLAMPIFGDQPKNALFVKSKNFGSMLTWKEMTPQSLRKSIQDVLENKIYRDTVTTTSKYFRDQLATPLEKAVWWTEYVIRHKGAPQLQCQGKQLSWFAYLYLDLIVFIHVSVIVLYKLGKFIVGKLSGRKEKGRKSKRD